MHIREFPMTFQIGLVGTDGIVLASDRKSIFYEPVWHSSLNTKIATDESKGFAVAWAGQEIATIIGRQILKEFNPENRTDFIFPLESLARRVIEERKQNYQYADLLEGQVTLVMQSDLTNFHVLEIFAGEPLCHVSNDKRIMGDKGNAAIYFAQAYYRKASTSELLKLAAQTVVSAGRLNPSGIEGLQILLCTRGGFQFVPEDQIESLTKESEELYWEIEAKIFP